MNSLSEAQPTPGRIVSITLPSSHCWHILAAGLPLMECVLQLGIRSSVIHLIAFYELGSDTKERSGLTNRSFPWCEEKKVVDAIVNNQTLFLGSNEEGSETWVFLQPLPVIGTGMWSWASQCLFLDFSSSTVWSDFNLVWKTQDLLDLFIDGVLERKMVGPLSVSSILRQGKPWFI